MEKVIVENRTDMSMSRALNFAMRVVERGKESKTKKGKQYCFVTDFLNGVIVYADKNKKSDRLIITRAK